jgi:hypothetical protein
MSLPLFQGDEAFEISAVCGSDPRLICVAPIVQKTLMVKSYIHTPMNRVRTGRLLTMAENGSTAVTDWQRLRRGK